MDIALDQKRIPRELWIVTAVGFVAALAMVLFALRSQASLVQAGDPYGYGEIAHGLVEHGFDKVTRRAAMLYPHLLWGIYELGGNDLVAQLLHVAMHTGTCLITFVIARHLFNVRTGLLAGLAAALHPMLLRYIGELHTEALLAFLFALTIWRTIRFHDEPSIRNGVVLGVIGMMGVLAKGIFLPYLVIFGAVWFVRGILQRARRGAGTARGAAINPIAGVIALAVTMTLIVAPWTYRNYQVSGGRFVLLTPGSPDAFLRGYIFTRLEFATLQKPPYTDAENESNNLFKRLAKEAGTTWEVDEMVDDINNGREAKRRIREEPLDTLRKVAVGMFTFWYEMTSLRNSLVPAFLAIVAWALAFVGLKRAREESRPAWLLWLPILVMNFFVAVFIPLGRYSVPVLPMLSILAAFGLDTLLQKRAQRHAQQLPA